jgi:hypothetical protein
MSNYSDSYAWDLHRYKTEKLRDPRIRELVKQRVDALEVDPTGFLEDMFLVECGPAFIGCQTREQAEWSDEYARAQTALAGLFKTVYADSPSSTFVPLTKLRTRRD